MRTGAPVIPLFAFPLPDGRYRMIYEHPVEPPPSDTPDAVREFTQRCTDVLEMHVRRHPELWLWMQRRWRDAQAAMHHVQNLEGPIYYAYGMNLFGHPLQKSPVKI